MSQKIRCTKSNCIGTPSRTQQWNQIKVKLWLRSRESPNENDDVQDIRIKTPHPWAKASLMRPNRTRRKKCEPATHITLPVRKWAPWATPEACKALAPDRISCPYSMTNAGLSCPSRPNHSKKLTNHPLPSADPISSMACVLLAVHYYVIFDLGSYGLINGSLCHALDPQGDTRPLKHAIPMDFAKIRCLDCYEMESEWFSLRATRLPSSSLSEHAWVLTPSNSSKP